LLHSRIHGARPINLIVKLIYGLPSPPGHGESS
jgi:hypothetical protein